jgi:hypothetical protein
MKKYASRKFLFALGTLLAATALLWLGKLTGAEYVSLVSADLLFYGAANVGHRFATRGETPTP